jgi:hypothetical protein
VVALHNATNGGAQFYTGCAQVFLESSGNLVPESTVSIPGYVKAGEDSVKFNIYNNKNSDYKIPGPPVAKLTSSGAATDDAQTTQTEGLRPDGAIIENANWFGTEVPDYSDETGCWASGEKCWNQLDVCYKSAPPTGSKGCEIWQTKCQGINDACKAKDFSGPPNRGKDLTPKAQTIEIGLVMETAGGGVAATPKTTTEATKEEQPKTTAAAVSKAETSSKTSTTAVANTPTAAAPSSKVATSAALPTFSYAASSPKTTTTVPATGNAPAPTEKATCPKGYACVTEVEMQYVTVTEYVTVGAQKRRSMHQRRRGGLL